MKSVLNIGVVLYMTFNLSVMKMVILCQVFLIAKVFRISFVI